MSIDINVSRINMVLHGVSAQIIEEALDDLEQELTRRLGVMNIGQSLASRASAVDIEELALGPLQSGATLDAGSLRGIIAECLVQIIQQQLGGLE
jgi:hypothetical protein